MQSGTIPHSPVAAARIQPQLETAVLWFRRDLRVADNPALCAAVQAARHVVAVFLWSPEEDGQFQPGRCSRWWLNQSLAGFRQDLSALGCTLVLRRVSEARQGLLDLVHEVGAQALFFNHQYDPISMVRDNEVKAAMASKTIFCQSFNGEVLYEPWEILGPGGQPFTNFEDYWSRVMSMPYPPPALLPIPTRFNSLARAVASLELQDLELLSAEEEQSNQQLLHQWSPGSRGAHAMMRNFVMQRLRAFSFDRAKTDRDSTSNMSPHIHWGEISARQVYYVVTEQVAHASPSEGFVKASAADYLRQMGFREYARYLSFHFPFTHERPLLQHLRAMPWHYDQRLFKAWRQGRTGYPLVDAGMRQLWSTGWLHNRARVVCASFLVKNLLLPWQWGLKHFWDALLDADLECDALGWQYCSGCLIDAHPLGHMIDHQHEAKRYDPEGNWVRRWLPVLARLPVQYIHRPWAAPSKVLSDAGVELGSNYELPVVAEEESATHLAYACSMVEQSLASDAPNAQMPYRQASIANPGPQYPAPSVASPVTRQQPRGESYAQAAQGGERSQQWPPSAGADTFNPMSKHRSEEVYSNNPAVSSRRRPMPTSMPGSAGAHAVNQLPHCSPLPHPQMQMQKSSSLEDIGASSDLPNGAALLAMSTHLSTDDLLIDAPLTASQVSLPSAFAL